MSLVCYAESDESSDEEEPKEVPHSVIVGEKEDKKGQETILKKRSIKNINDVVDTSNEETAKPKSIGNLFSSLPAPWMSSVSWASKDGLRKQVEVVNKQQTVKISLPVVEGSDSDDDDNTGPKQEKKQITASQKSSGLFGLLPKPKNSVVVKENNPNRPVTKISNRPLIPDSLRRKQTKKPPQQKKQIINHDSDDDDDENVTSFFTFETKQDMKLESINEPPHKTLISVYNNKLTQPVDTEKIAEDVTTAGGSQSTNTTSCTYPTQYSTIHGFENQNSYVEMTETHETGYPASVEPDYSYISNMTTEPSYNYAQPGTHEQYGVEYCQPQDEPIPELNPNQLKKGKRRHGEENLNIIDVNADDQVGPSSDWKTRYKQDDTGYQPQSKKTGHLPSSQQRRKHQITYLAFQAKETEWELRNQWATNSQTRRQTQSKYGF